MANKSSGNSAASARMHARKSLQLISPALYIYSQPQISRIPRARSSQPPCKFRGLLRTYSRAAGGHLSPLSRAARALSTRPLLSRLPRSSWALAAPTLPRTHVRTLYTYMYTYASEPIGENEKMRKRWIEREEGEGEEISRQANPASHCSRLSHDRRGPAATLFSYSLFVVNARARACVMRRTSVRTSRTIFSIFGARVRI